MEIIIFLTKPMHSDPECKKTSKNRNVYFSLEGEKVNSPVHR